MGVLELNACLGTDLAFPMEFGIIFSYHRISGIDLDDAYRTLFMIFPFLFYIAQRPCIT